MARISGASSGLIANRDESSVGGSGGATAANQTTMITHLSAIETAVEGELTVVGNVADNDVDSGNPIKVGGVYNSTRPTWADGDRVDMQFDSRGNQYVTLIDSDSEVPAVIDEGTSDDRSAFERGLVTNSRLHVFDGTAWDRLLGNSTDGVLVNLGSNNDVTVTGTVTAELSATDNAVLDAILVDTGQIEALLTTIDLDTSVLSGLVLATQADDVVNTSDGLQVTNFNMVFDGTTWDRARGDSTNGVLVNLGSNNDVSVSGTVTADTEFPAATLLADGTASPTTTTVGAFNFVRDTVNGDWDFIVRANATADTTGAGIQASGIMAVFDDTTPSSVTENRFAHIRMSSRKELYTQIRDAAGNERGLNIDASGNLTANLGATDNQVLDDISADTGAIATDAAAIEVLLGTIDADTGGILTAVQIMDDWDNAASDGASVSGDVAHDSGDAGEPVKIGMKAFSPDGTTPGTAVAENDRTDAKGDLDGRLFVNTTHPRRAHKHLDGSTAYTDESLVADPGDGFQVVITSIIVSTGAATAMNFFLEEGSTKIFGPIYLEAVAGRGFVSGPINLPVTASTAVTITTSASIAQAVDVDYFIQAV